MTYHRVIPRDLFNEAKLLKCLGKLYIESEYEPEGTIVMHRDDEDDLFRVEQDPTSGCIYVDNIMVLVNGKRVWIYTGLNAKSDYPMYADFGGETIAVFDMDGNLTEEFLKIGLPVADVPEPT